MSRIRLIHWPKDVTVEDRQVFDKIWRSECGGALWESDYSRALAIMEGSEIAAVLIYVRLSSHCINFGRMTVAKYRGKGYAGKLLKSLIRRFPYDALECENVNRHLTAGLERHGFRRVSASDVNRPYHRPAKKRR